MTCTYDGRLRQVHGSRTSSNGAASTETADGNGLLTRAEEAGIHDYYLYTEDAKGSRVNVLDNAGSRVVSYLYDDFGDVTESKATGYSGFENEIQYICRSTGLKIVTNAIASWSVILTYFSHKSVNGLPGGGFSTGISFCMGLKLGGNAGVDVATNGKLTFHGGGIGHGIGFPIPYWDTEFGYTKQLKKLELKKISKRKKTYTALFQKVKVQRVGKHTEVTKGRRKVKIYDKGRVKAS